MSLRYLCLTTQSQLDADMDTWWSRMTAGKTQWGYDFEGWDATKNVDENLRARFGTLDDFDAVFLSFSFTFGDPHNVVFPAPTRASLGAKPAVAFVHEIVDTMQFDPNARRWPVVGLEAADVVLYAYAAEQELDAFLTLREQARREPGAHRRASQTFTHVPHHVRTDIFAPPAGGDAARDIDVLLAGRCREDIYPLRARWQRLIEAGTWTSAVHRPPPYEIADPWTRELFLAQQDDFVRTLQRSKIVLSCSSHWRYMLQKLTEIPSAGAFLVSDVPAGLPPEYLESMGVVSMAMTDAELVDVVNGWLRADDERRRRAARLGAFVRERFDMRHFWTKVDEAVGTWLRSRLPRPADPG